MRLFANAGTLSKVLNNSMAEDEALTSPILNWSIENAQKRYEQHNFAIRKRLLQYDDVLNNQREVVYGIRNEAIHSDDPREIMFDLIREELDEKAALACDVDRKQETRTGVEGFVQYLNHHFPIGAKLDDYAGKPAEEIASIALGKIREAFLSRETFEDAEELKRIARYVVIRSIDRLWQDHLTEMEDLRRSVSLRGYAQKDPLNEYKSEAFIYFEEMMNQIRSEVCSACFRTAANLQAFQTMLSRLSRQAREEGPNTAATSSGTVSSSSGSGASRSASQDRPQRRAAPAVKVEPVRRDAPKVGRNDPCPTGCGKKVKKCQG